VVLLRSILFEGGKYAPHQKQVKFTWNLSGSSSKIRKIAPLILANSQLRSELPPIRDAPRFLVAIGRIYAPVILYSRKGD
jgi:hypothetical protein